MPKVKAHFLSKIKIKKGDKVKVMAGKDKGREGVVEKVFPKRRKIVVSGINLYKKHLRAQRGKQGGIVDVLRPLSLSNVAFLCPKCGKTTRLGFKSGPEKTRICRKCQEAV